MKAKHAIATSNGVSACLNAARALVPRGATFLIGNTTYYEVALRLKREAVIRNWTVESFDPGNTNATLESIRSVRSCPPLVLWIDQPSNWWLEEADLATLAVAVKQRGGIVIADISLHPLVPAFAQGADVVIASLSKYPSSGFCLGGIALTNNETLANHLLQQRAHDASALSAERAFAISQQMASFDDRFSVVSSKAAKLAEFAKALPGVRAVRYPRSDELKTTGGGGVLVLELNDAEYGARAEEIIAQNFHRADFPLTLACTFGGVRTTFEHFQPRGKANDEVVGSLVKALPDNFCRVGVGCESYEAVRDGLALAFPRWP